LNDLVDDDGPGGFRQCMKLSQRVVAISTRWCIRQKDADQDGLFLNDVTCCARSIFQPKPCAAAARSKRIIISRSWHPDNRLDTIAHMEIAAAISSSGRLTDALDAVISQASETLKSRPAHLAIVAITNHFEDEAESIARTVRERIDVATL